MEAIQGIFTLSLITGRYTQPIIEILIIIQADNRDFFHNNKIDGHNKDL